MSSGKRPGDGQSAASTRTGPTRRALLQRSVALGGATLAAARARAATPAVEAQALASDERHWRHVADDFDVKTDITNLENGYWGIMARPVLEKYLAASRFVNRDNSFYARRGYDADYARTRARIARAVGAKSEEIALTRGATEALQGLIGGYNRLRPGDAVMYADLDYYSMQAAMDALAARNGCEVVRLAIPEPTGHDALVAFYDAALAANPKVLLLLITHVSHRTGLLIPARAIIAAARARGVDVIVDAAHSFGQIDMTLANLDADFVGFNLHKWIGAPIGAGLMYIRPGRLADISPNPSSQGDELQRTDGRVHTGTANFAAFMTVPDALDYHDRVGPLAIAARLRYLRNLWVTAVRDVPGLQILTPDDDRLHAGMTSFRFAGKTSVDDNKAIVERLVRDFGIFTVHRDGVAKGACVRVTPAIYNGAGDVLRLADALKKIAPTL